MKENKNMKEIVIKIDGKDWEEAIDKAYKTASAKAKIDGFRPGKAPKEIFMKKYGEPQLLMDAGDLCIEKAYDKMLKENEGIEIVAQPEVKLESIDAEKGIEFKFFLTLKPEVKLGKYTNLGVKKEEVKVTKEEISEAIDNMRNRYAENIEKDGEVVANDIAIIDFEGSKEGVPFEGGKGENYSLKIGSNTFIPGFEDQVIGMKKGEEKDIKVTFPKDYHADDLKDQEVVFKVKVNGIKEVKIPELDKDFFEDLGMEGIDSKESLEKQVEENIKAHKSHEVEDKYIDELLKTAAKDTKVDIPEAMVNDELHRMIHQYEDNLKMQGISLEQFYQFTQSNEDALKDQMREEANNRVLYRLMLEEIAKVEKLEATDKEVEEEISKLVERYQMDKDELLKSFGGTEMVKYDIQMRKAIELLQK